MLSPNPLSLLCAILLCLPLAVIFTTTTHGTNNHSINTTIPTKYQQKSDKTRVNPLSPPHPPPLPEDDESLFCRAAKVNSKPLPLESPQKLAFLFLTTTPLPFAPLWELYFNGIDSRLYNIYVHADPSSLYDPPFSGVFSGRVIPSKPTRRFTPTLISAARRLLAHALLDDSSNSRFALLSASCIPLHSFNFTYKTLIRSKKSFMEILKNETGAYGRWAARGNETMLPEVPLESFRIGSQFFAVTRRHARIIVSDRRLWSKFKLPCVQWDTCYPEENYFPTLLSMRDPRGCVPATLTNVDWSGRSDGHPRTYQAAEVGPELILSLRNRRPRYGDDEPDGTNSSLTRRHDPFLFARKFSPDALEPLRSLANDVILQD